MLDISEDLLSHEFSRAYIRNRDKLIRRRSRSYYKLISTAGRRIACFIIAFFIAIFATIFSVEALRTAFVDFITQIFSTHTVFQSADTENAPETIEEIYVITHDMSEYEIGLERYDERSRYIDYVIGTEKMVAFVQYVKPDWSPHVNTEDAVMEEFKLGDITGIYFLDNNGYNSYMWDNGDYILRIYGNIDKSEMELIILSVQKAE